jgi:hypothetical protein
MKTSPTKPSMTFYSVMICGEVFETTASGPRAAISRCAFKYGSRMNVPVALVQYRIKNGELPVEIKEG